MADEGDDLIDFCGNDSLPVDHNQPLESLTYCNLILIERDFNFTTGFFCRTTVRLSSVHVDTMGYSTTVCIDTRR